MFTTIAIHLAASCLRRFLPMNELVFHHPALRVLLDSEEAAVFVRAGEVSVCNAAACRLLGVECDALAGRSPFDFSPPIQPDGTPSTEGVQRRMESARAGLPQWFQWQFRRADGELVAALIHLEAVRFDGNDCLVARVRNVSHLWNEEILREAALAVSGAEGPDIFDQLVRSLATILKADVALIAVFSDDSGEQLRTVALFLDGQIVPNVEYRMADTPCADVVGREFRYYPAQVRGRFPADSMMAGLGVESYAGYPLNDAACAPLGLVVVMARSPLASAELTESMLKIFAVRAAAEIERGRAEAALRASEANYRAIFEAAEDAIFIHDYDTGAIVDVNPKACSAYGYSHEEMKHLSVADVSSGEPSYTLEEAGKFIARAKTGEPVRFEWHRRNKDGTLHWDEVCLKQAVIAGRPRIVAFKREITERKLAEQSLRASEGQYRAIFNASADALVLWNSRSQRVDVNPAYERMYGYSRDEVLGGARGRDVPAEHRQRQVEIIARTLSGERCHEEIETVRRSGERFPIEVRTIPILHRGEPHVLAMIRDLTERRRVEQDRAQLEAQLRQAQKMEAIGHLAGGIAHDFNNILTSIMGYIALAAERDAAVGDDQLAKYLHQANLSCERARDLIQQILTFSRGRKSERQPMSLARVVRESTNLLRSSLPATLELVSDLDANAPPAMLDPVQAGQVLLNLCINARDATAGSGAVRLAVRGVMLDDGVCASCRQPVRGEFTELVVQDTGPGIAPAVMERMFEPFFTTKDVGKGSGMGLSTVHGIVHEHGGHILVESTPRRGATFRVLFPALDRAQRDSGADAASPKSSCLGGPSLTGHVLVVDDEAMVGEFMRDLLESWGLRVTLTVNGAEAQDTFAIDPSRFHAVITDQTMPRLTGLALTRELLAVRPDLPVILYTGYSEGLTEADAKAAGALALVHKPVKPFALRALLESALAARVPRTE
jgi:PAS domain S-box-containing protein